MPDQFQLSQQPVDNDWMLAAEVASPALDAMIRDAGWHFMWMHGSCKRKGFGRTSENATGHALIHALKGVAGRFNAAELDSVRLAKFLGFHIATVTLQPRQIQRHTFLALLDESLGQH